MRRAGEIEIYLMNKYWSEYFVENSKVKGNSFLLSGRSGKWTIRAAFNWEKSPQGEKYWKQVNDEFMKWYEEG